MELAFVTSNPGKVREARAILRPFGLTVRPVARVLPEPQADTLEEVARAKLAALRTGPRYQFIEDSGLFIPSLGGFPGVYSAHFYRIWKFGPLLELLEDRSRRATFRTVAGLRYGSRRRFFTGECSGTIAPKPRGTGGFGFDPIFIPTGSDATYAQMTDAEKRKISHRGRALRGMAEWLTARKR